MRNEKDVQGSEGRHPDREASQAADPQAATPKSECSAGSTDAQGPADPHTIARGQAEEHRNQCRHPLIIDGHLCGWTDDKPLRLLLEHAIGFYLKHAGGLTPAEGREFVAVMAEDEIIEPGWHDEPVCTARQREGVETGLYALNMLISLRMERMHGHYDDEPGPFVGKSLDMEG